MSQILKQSTAKQEYWKDIIGYENIYMISNLGNIKRIGKPNNRKLVLRGGYYQIILSKEGEVNLHWVHRLVAIVFLGLPIRDIYEVNHKDGNKLNNQTDNLEWVTPSGNIKHAYDIGLRVAAPSVGSKNGNSKLNEKDIEIISSLKKNGETLQKIADRYGVTKSLIWQIIHNLSWKHVKRCA